MSAIETMVEGLPDSSDKKNVKDDIKLKSCPFCGGTQNRNLVYDDFGTESAPQWTISCSKCGGSGPYMINNTSKERAKLAWNKRVGE